VEIDRVVEELENSSATLEELSEFLGIEEPVEGRILDMGRAARA
jgi:hypothetical protein